MNSATVETFLAMARDAILDNAEIPAEQRDKLAQIKVTYGAGNGTYRGITFFSAWQLADANATDFVEIAASAQESWIQLAGTLLHELAHSLAGVDAGHGKEWKAACVRLGFQVKPEAAGQRYFLSLFKLQLRQALYVIAQSLRDGSPVFRTGSYAPTGKGSVRPCRAGTGTRGGTSRGAGSGSRLRLWECQDCERPVKVRIASDDFQATCNRCETAFTRKP